MAARIHLEEPLALVVAIALHAGLLAVLVTRPANRPPPPPPRMEVSLADAVGLQETAPAAKEPAAADIAPKLGTAPPPPPPPQQVLPQPQPRPVPHPIVAPMPQPKPLPVPAPAPPKPAAPKPLPPKPVPPKPAPPKPIPAKPVLRPDPIAALTAAAEAQAKAKAQAQARGARAQAKDDAKLADAAPQDTPRKAGKTVGGSRIGADFLSGATSANTTGHSKVAPSHTPGPAVLSAIAAAIGRQLKEHWTAPQGADADKLVTVLAYDLNPDGTLDGPPRVVRQEGVTDSNRPQAARHAEQAIRAVELAEPFQLPPEYYDTWKHISASRFDRKLSQ